MKYNVGYQENLDIKICIFSFCKIVPTYFILCDVLQCVKTEVKASVFMSVSFDLDYGLILVYMLYNRPSFCLIL